ncbi:hypothetical protein D9M71_92350 [compost metagenome]
MATFQPSPGLPMMFSAAVRASLKNTSLNSLVPVSCWIGCTSMPAWSIGTSRKLRPWWPTLPGSVRASTKHHCDSWAREVHTFCPLISHSLPLASSWARVLTPARSEPAPGSE